MFNEYYRKALAKRLLGDKSASDELERSLISKLKLRCGQQFTFKLDGMVRLNAPPGGAPAPAPAARPPFHSQRASRHPARSFCADHRHQPGDGAEGQV